jgi:hypothetical protein
LLAGGARHAPQTQAPVQSPRVPGADGRPLLPRAPKTGQPAVRKVSAGPCQPQTLRQCVAAGPHRLPHGAPAVREVRRGRSAHTGWRSSPHRAARFRRDPRGRKPHEFVQVLPLRDHRSRRRTLEIKEINSLYRGGQNFYSFINKKRAWGHARKVANSKGEYRNQNGDCRRRIFLEKSRIFLLRRRSRF